MTRFLGLFLLVVALTLAGCAREEHPGPQLRHLPNGLTVIARENRGADVVSVQAWVRDGPLFEAADASGTAYVLARAILSQLETRSGGAAARAIEAVGGHTAAISAQDHTHFVVTVPSARFDLALDVLADEVLRPEFGAVDVQNAKVQAHDMLDAWVERPIDRALLLCLRAIAGDHPMSRPVPGSPRVVGALDADALRARHSERYVGANMAVVVVGNVNPREAADKVERAFAGLPKGQAAQPAAPPVTWPETPVRAVEKTDQKRAYLVMGFPGPGVKDPDHMAIDVLMMALATGRASRLSRTLVDERGLVSSVGGGWYSRQEPSPCFVWMELAPENVVAAEGAVVDLVASLAEHPLTAEDLGRGKALLTSYMTLQNETCEQQAAYEGYWYTTAGEGYADSYLAGIDAVTLEDLRKAAATYLRPQARATAVLEPAWVR